MKSLSRHAIHTCALSLLIATASCDNGGGGGSPPEPLPIVVALLFPGAQYDPAVNWGGSIAVADLDGDGFDDVVTGHDEGISPLLAQGDGTFLAGTVLPGDDNVTFDVVTADFNSDDIVDFGAQSLGATSIMFGIGDGTFGAPAQIIHGTSPPLVAGDMDRDGDIDLIAASALQGPQLMRNNGSGRFASPESPLIPDSTRVIALGDFNDDGAPDVVCGLAGDQNLSILLNDGAGRLGSELRFVQGTTAVAVGDLNGDDLPDVVGIGRRALADEVWAMLSQGNGTFAPPIRSITNAAVTGIVLHDFNGDSNLDLLIGDTREDALSVRIGNGDGSFQSETLLFPAEDVKDLALGRFNADSSPDLAVGFASGTAMYLGSTDGFNTPARYALDSFRATAIALADFNEDDAPDIFVAGNSGYITLTGNPDGTFGGRTEVMVPGDFLSVRSVDADEDCFSDIVLANIGTDTLDVFFGDGTGNFGRMVSLTTGDGPLDIATGDFNGDGRVDIASVEIAANRASVFVGNGQGVFSSRIARATGRMPTAVVAGNFDSDHIDDFAVANDSDGWVSVFLGRASGGPGMQIRVTVEGSGCRSVASGDFNGDSIDDLAVISTVFPEGRLNVLLGLGDGTFESFNVTPIALFARIGVADVTADGILDLIASPIQREFTTDFAVYPGLGDGSFATPQRFSFGSGARGFVLADVNGDSAIDIVGNHDFEIIVLIASLIYETAAPGSGSR